MFALISALFAAACAPFASRGGSTPAGSSIGSGGQMSGPSPAPIAGGAGPIKQWPNPPAMTIDVNRRYTATISTNLGDMKAQLLPNEAPNTVNNFVFLAREGFYNGVPFHRIIAGFMVQTGDPTGTGRGGPGYRFNDELPHTTDYERGTLAMANAGPNTQGSQFFICHADLRGRLPKQYTIFGKLIDGLDVLDRIASTPVKPSPFGELSVPTQDVHITTVTIEER